jgi:hypothetical protein
MHDIAAETISHHLMIRSDSLILRVQFISFLLIVLLSCSNDHEDTPAKFVSTPVSLRITPGAIDEVSGIADSKANAGNLWVEQDGGNSNDIFLLSYAGAVVKKINIKSSANRDWEDIVIGNGPAPGINYLYLADIGDNNRVFSEYTIYRFEEPLATTDTVFNCTKIRFKYADGSHDAESILVDKSSKDIYIITKQDAGSRIYKLAYPQDVTITNTAAYVGSLPFNEVVSAASSPAGDELLVKTYTSLYYWKRSTNETIEQALQRNPTSLTYQFEPQGEAICFRNDNSGFYTLSERPSMVAEVKLNFYGRE